MGAHCNGSKTNRQLVQILNGIVYECGEQEYQASTTAMRLAIWWITGLASEKDHAGKVKRKIVCAFC
jgi:hypothetical protein